MDTRCLEHDHHWLEDDLYDMSEDGGYVPASRETQLGAKCTRCGITMRESFKRIADECRTLLSGRLN